MSSTYHGLDTKGDHRCRLIINEILVGDLDLLNFFLNSV